MKNKRNFALMLIIVLFVVIIVITLAFILFRTILENNSRNSYNSIASSYASDVAESTNAPAIDTDSVENPIDFKALKEKNSEIYSWIYVPGTSVNYPVCQSANNDFFYLNHDVNKEYSYAGAIYSQFKNKRNYSDRITVLYGHNMADGSMFATLHRFRDSSFFDEHEYMYVYTEDRKLTYKIVSAFEYDDRHILNSFDSSDDNSFKEYLNTVKNPHSLSANVRDGFDLTVNDKILTLSTCLNTGEGRYLVQGVLVKDEPTK